MTNENFETTTVEEVSTVEVCDSCGTDLSDVEPRFSSWVETGLE